VTAAFPPTASDINRLWQRRVDEGATEEIKTALTDAAYRIHSRRSRADVAALLDQLDGSTREAACWWEVICGWPYGFPPQPVLTPAHLYPLSPPQED